MTIFGRPDAKYCIIQFAYKESLVVACHFINLFFSSQKKFCKRGVIDLFCITLQWANMKKWGRGLGGQFHTNHCILSTWASSWCPCLQECGKGLLVCSWHKGEVWPVASEKIGVTGRAYKKKQFSWCKKSIFIFSLMLVTSMLYERKLRCSL